MYTITIQSDIYKENFVYNYDNSTEVYKDYYEKLAYMAKLVAMANTSFTIKMECDVLGLVEKFEGEIIQL